MRIRQFLKQFNWRFLLVRIVVNAIALAITALVVPKIYFVDKSIWNLLLMAVMLGVLNTLIKPILQFLTLQFIFVTYGLVIVLVNTLILLLLSFLFPTRFAVDNLLWALVGGLVFGLLSSSFESLLGLTMPIVPDEPPELRQQLEEEARHTGWLVNARPEAIAEEQALAIEPAAPDAEAAEPAIPGPPEAVESKPLDAEVAADPEPAPRPEKEESEEDRS
ncbi:phage holin family protein [Chloroflexota bacterium]